jgi:hypothetical protein
VGEWHGDPSRQFGVINHEGEVFLKINSEEDSMLIEPWSANTRGKYVTSYMWRCF